MTVVPLPGPLPLTGPTKKPVADCYSGGERSWMERTQAWRARALGPSLRVMASWGIRPDHVTLASLLVGLLFCPLWFISPTAALVALFLHVVIDGVDGPLARHLGIASARGSFTDTMADQVIVTATTVVLIHAGLVGAVGGSLYVFAYVLVIALAMVRNALHVPYSWLVRPRFLVYAWIPIELMGFAGSLEWVVWGAVLVLGAKALTGFVQLRRAM